VGDRNDLALDRRRLALSVRIDLLATIVGWSMSERIDRKLVLDALKMALAQRRAAAGLLTLKRRKISRQSEY
jgi:transposase InsO family protein